MSERGIIQVTPNWWIGHRVFVLDTVARIIPSMLSAEILARCRQDNVSLELCAFTGDDPSSLSLLLIIRSESAFYYELLDRMERVAGMIFRLLTRANFKVQAVNDNDDVPTQLSCLLNGKRAYINQGIGFFPMEKKIGPNGYYIPGRYHVDYVKQFDLTRLAAILTAYPYAMFALQLVPTVLTKQEIDVLENNKAWYMQHNHDEAARIALGAYIQLERMLSLPLLFVNVFCVGNQDFARDMIAQLGLYQFSSYQLPQTICHSSDYFTNGIRDITYAATLWGHQKDSISKLQYLHRITHIAPTIDVISALPLPQSGDRISGIKVSSSREEKYQIPTALKDEKGIFLGKQDNTGESIFLHPDQLTRHGFIVGKSGSGKTTYALWLLYQLYKKNYPFLAIEPAKHEYRSLLSVIPDLWIYTPGNSSLSPMSLNPFIPPKGITLEEYLPNLDTIFNIAIAVDHPLDVVFPQAIRSCYRKHGWRMDSTCESPEVHIFGMTEFICAYREYIHQAYAENQEAKNNMESGGVVRLQALTRSHPVLFDTNQSMDFEKLLQHPTVIELDAVDNTDQKALILAILMVQIMLVIRKRRESNGELKNLIMIDEAHLLLSQASSTNQGAPNPSAASIRLLQNMTLLLRAYGTAILFGDQSPYRLTREIIDNVNLKMMFRLDSQRDRSILADTALMNNDMLVEMVNLPAGKGFMYVDVLSKPICIITPNSKKELHLKNEVLPEEILQTMHPRLLPPYSQCKCCHECTKECQESIRSEARFIAENLIESKNVHSILAQQDQGLLLEFISDSISQQVLESISASKKKTDNISRLVECTKVHFIRLLLETGQCKYSQETLIGAAWA